MFLGGYDALLFDMDGTLLTSIAAVERAWTAWAKRAGADSSEVIGYLHGRRSVDAIRRFATQSMDIDEEVRWLDALELEDIEGISAVAGARQLLDSLPVHQWAVVTSANRELAGRRIGAAGLPHPPYLVSSDDVEHGKPDPEGFLKAAAALGKNPARCLVFEDTQAGARAGLAAGADVIRIAGTEDMPAIAVRATIQSFEDLKVEFLDGTIRVSLRARPFAAA